MLSRLFHRRYLISLSYLLVVIIGIIAWQNISLEMSPDLSLPSITVSYSWGSTSPEVMEQEVTRKVEQAANRLRDVQRIESISREGQSTVTITFNRQAPVEYRKVELQEYLFSLQEALPSNVRQPSISRRVPEELQDMQTFVVYSLSGERSVRELLEYARRNIRLSLLGLDGIAGIEINGARDPALAVEFDTDLLERYDIEPREVLNSIRRKLEWRSSGYIETSGRRISMLVEPQFQDLAPIRQLPLQVPGSQRMIRLEDVAEVAMQDYPAKTLKRINGSPALSINFIKESGADAIGLAEQIRAEMDRITQVLPSDITIQLEQDATEELRAQFGNLQYQALVSLLVVFIVLLLFIRRMRAPFVILGSILFSLLMSVAILYFIGYTLNIITLAGLTVSLGMIIDNAVVVFEQVNPGLPDDREGRIKHIQQQLPRALVPVLGSTFTTVGIFIPLFFAMEELQLFLVPLAVALSFTLISSVFIALSWIPYSLIWLVPGDTNGKNEKGIKSRISLFSSLRRYLLLLFSWRHKLRWLCYAALIAAIGIPLFAIEQPDWEEDTAWPEFTQAYFDNRNDIDPWIGGITYRFFNDTYFGSPWGRDRQQRINVSIETPQGTPLEEIDKMARNFERIVKPYEEAFSFYETRISEYSGARLVFYIKDEYLAQPDPYIFYAEAMFLAARTGNSAISVNGLGDGMSTGFGSSSSSHRVSMTGYSYDELLRLAEDLRSRLMKNRRVEGVDIHGTGWYSREDLYQYYLELNDEELALHGLNRREVLSAISLDVNPTNTFGKVELAGQQMYLIGRNRAQQNTQGELMREKRVTNADSTTFVLADVATIGREKSQSMIRRENQSYHRTVRIDFLGPYRLGEQYIEGVLEETPVPVGTTMEFGSGGLFSYGSEDRTQNLLLLLGLTLLSVWMIVSALLESWADPLVVILAVPLSLLGIMAGSLYHDLAFDRGAIAGTLLCVGVVVNNSILLMHEKQLYRSLGIHGLRSWLYVYKNKMRAVLITTLTTIGGLIPLIVIGGSDFWQTLATVVVWGLGTSTVLILLLMGVWEKNS
ncbi:efflux RND transporter permease subunit [Aliifodinibius sp. S!AR15-10]|uniref:efflux RND transporter permease subunit n=1 Tax=Aliifodinibius sp. S!AR15-10 TaxID=2950437 RepID=UPI0028653FAD|nr:efflux RND transporter permease subunit [Aliifodinibius sp. S!AR15-10]MDR8394567.1 efflux RND transporter permease subunit [Aliifodinibius sp. S!AR15-10]